MALTSQIQQAINDVRYVINDPPTRGKYADKRIIRELGLSWDRVLDDVNQGLGRNAIYVTWDLVTNTTDTDYLLPAGMGQVARIDTVDSTGQIVGIVPAFGLNNWLGFNFMFNPPFIRWQNKFTQSRTFRIHYVPSGVDYLHQGAVTELALKNRGDANVQVVTKSGTTGTFSLRFRGATTSGVSLTETASALEVKLESLSSITDVTVTGSSGGPWTVTFVSPTKEQPLLVAANVSGDANATVKGTNALVSATAVLDTTPSLGDFDPRPNGFIGGMIRIYNTTGSNPTGFTFFPWAERRIITYDPDNVDGPKIEVNSAWDVDFGENAGTYSYEIVPMIEPRLMSLASVEAARRICSFEQRVERMRLLIREYRNQLAIVQKYYSRLNKVRQPGAEHRLDKVNTRGVVVPIRSIIQGA